ncbi:MAG: FAD-dependent oxidoreductase [Eggerthella lenta]
MSQSVTIVGAGLAGSEAALQLADRGVRVRLVEMRPKTPTPVHVTGCCAELVCSNSLKSEKPDSAAGMLKRELAELGSQLYAQAKLHAVPAGGALAVDRTAFAEAVTALVEAHPLIDLVHDEIVDLVQAAEGADALVVAAGRSRPTLAASLSGSPAKSTWPSTTPPPLSSWPIRSTTRSCSARAATRTPPPMRATI